MSLYLISAVSKSQTYRFRYRAQNCHGWGPFSPELYVLAASVPQAPAAPSAVSISATTLTLQLYPSQSNGGSVVTGYTLYRNEGSDGSSLVVVTSYVFESNGFSVTLVLGDEGMIPGRFY